MRQGGLMTETRPSFARRHPWTTVALGSVAALGIIAGIVGLKINSLAAERWDGFVRKHDATLQRLLADDGRRTPLLCPATPGNAWDRLLPLLADCSGAQALSPSGVPVSAPSLLKRIREAAHC